MIIFYHLVLIAFLLLYFDYLLPRGMILIILDLIFLEAQPSLLLSQSKLMLLFLILLITLFFIYSFLFSPCYSCFLFGYLCPFYVLEISFWLILILSWWLSTLPSTLSLVYKSLYMFLYPSIMNFEALVSSLYLYPCLKSLMA